MKHARKLFSLFLAIALVLSVFALPAAAAEPRAAVCSICKRAMRYNGYRDIQQSTYHVMDGSCPNDSYNHPHFVCERYDLYYCDYCKYEHSVYRGTIDICSAT